MTHSQIIFFIKEQLLTNPNVDAQEVSNITSLAETDIIMYTLLCKYMEQENGEEKNSLYKDMQYRLKGMNNVLPFKRLG